MTVKSSPSSTAEDEWLGIAHSVLIDIAEQMGSGESHLDQTRKRWTLTVRCRTLSIGLIYATGKVPVAFEVLVDGKPVARVGLTERELNEAVHASLSLEH